MRSALVIGAGPGVATAALVLARAGVAVTAIAAPETWHFPIGEGLPPAARPVLRGLALEARIAAQGHRRALGNVSAWGSDRLAATDFIMHPFGHGWHLDRAAYDSALRDAAREAGASVVQGWLRDVGGGAGAWCARIATGNGARTIAADVVIDCSGRRCMFARRRGARRTRLDRLVAVAALMRSDVEDADATTLIEAERDGWWHTARLPDATRIVMFLTDSDLPAAREVRALDAFRARLQRTRHVGPRCAERGYAIATPLRLAAADSARLDRVHGEGWLAAGDAAASFDPISSQGIMSAMQSGQQAAAASLAGDATGYAAAIDAMHERYCAAWASVYAQELRWRDAPFWARRRAAPRSGRI